MIFVKVDVNVYTHPKFRAVGFEGVGLWCAMMAYTRDHLLDGRVPKHALDLFGGTVKDRRRILQKLLDVGLIEDSGDHHLLANYAAKGNDTKADVERRLHADRERKSRLRPRSEPVPIGIQADSGLESKRIPFGFPGSDSDSLSDLVLGGPGGATTSDRLRPEMGTPIAAPRRDASLPGREGAQDAPEPPKGVTARQLEYQRSYEQGVAAGKGSPYAMPEPQRGDLHRAIEVFAKDATGRAWRGPQLLGWIEHTAKEFAASVRGTEATYYSAYGPRGFVRWLNEAEVEEVSDVR